MTALVKNLKLYKYDLPGIPLGFNHIICNKI